MNVTRLTREVIRRTRLSSSCRLSFIRQSTLNSPQKFTNFTARRFSVFSKSPEYSEVPQMDLVTFESLSSVALESLTDYFEELVESDPKFATADVAYSVSFDESFVANAGDGS